MLDQLKGLVFDVNKTEQRMKWKYWSPEYSDVYAAFEVKIQSQNVTLFMSLTAIQWSFFCDNLNPLRESLACYSWELVK